VHRALGFDWLMLFLHGNVHQETVNCALRILVQLLSDSTLLQRFHEGDIFGGWRLEVGTRLMTGSVVSPLSVWYTGLAQCCR